MPPCFLLATKEPRNERTYLSFCKKAFLVFVREAYLYWEIQIEGMPPIFLGVDSDASELFSKVEPTSTHFNFTGTPATLPKRTFPYHRKCPTSLADSMTGTYPRHLRRYENQALKQSLWFHLIINIEFSNLHTLWDSPPSCPPANGNNAHVDNGIRQVSSMN